MAPEKKHREHHDKHSANEHVYKRDQKSDADGWNTFYEQPIVSIEYSLDRIVRHIAERSKGRQMFG